MIKLIFIVSIVCHSDTNKYAEAARIAALKADSTLANRVNPFKEELKRIAIEFTKPKEDGKIQKKARRN